MNGFEMSCGKVAEMQNFSTTKDSLEKSELCRSIILDYISSCQVRENTCFFEGSQFRLKYSCEFARQKRLPVPDFILRRHVPRFKIACFIRIRE
jgi:hypothetical protein